MIKITTKSVKSGGKTSTGLRNSEENLNDLIELMNDQSHTPILVTEELMQAFDVVFDPNEVAFLLAMGGGKHSKEQIKEKVKLSKRKFNKIFDSLLKKGVIIELKYKNEPNIYHIMTIMPGWFELYLQSGLETKQRRLFADKLDKFFKSMVEFGEPDFLNNMIRELGPNHSIFSMVPPTKSKTIDVGKTVKAEVTRVFPSKTVLEIFEKLSDNDVIGLAHCFCRQQRKLVGDPCRLEMPKQTCLYYGPIAEHQIEHGFADRITKEKAIKLVKEFRQKGAVHLVGKTAPLKGIDEKFEADNICSCCWDCCGLFGNYNRGNFPFVLKAYYIATIPEIKTCIGCGTCVDFCPLQAISLNDDEKAVINESRCCGCGLCAFHCSEKAIEMQPKEREVFLPLQDRKTARIPTIEEEKIEDDSEDIEDDFFTASPELVLEVLDEFHDKFMEDKVQESLKNWSKVMLFHFTDLNDYWTIEVKDGVPQPKQQGKVDNPDIVYEMKSGIFVKLMRNEISGTKALRKKWVRIKASFGDLMKLMKVS